MADHDERAAEVLDVCRNGGSHPAAVLGALSAAGLTVVDAGKVRELERLRSLERAAALHVERWGDDDPTASAAMFRPFLSETLGDDQ